MNLLNDQSDVEKDQISSIEISASLWAELLFVLLPFLITAIVLGYSENLQKIVEVPEWALAAAILAGQTIVKFIKGLIPWGENLERNVIALLVTSVIVLLLAPSLTILTLILTTDKPSLFLIVAQIILFVVSVIVFLLLGRISNRVGYIFTDFLVADE